VETERATDGPEIRSVGSLANFSDEMYVSSRDMMSEVVFQGTLSLLYSLKGARNNINMLRVIRLLAVGHFSCQALCHLDPERPNHSINMHIVLTACLTSPIREFANRDLKPVSIQLAMRWCPSFVPLGCHRPRKKCHRLQSR
jgi:hypothetical protein